MTDTRDHQDLLEGPNARTRLSPYTATAVRADAPLALTVSSTAAGMARKNATACSSPRHVGRS